MRPRSLTSPSLNEIPSDPSTERVIRRGLLIFALVTLLAPCGLCWVSTTVETAELIVIPASLAAIVTLYSLYTFYMRSQNQDLAPPLWRVGLAFLALALAAGLALLWLLRSVGWRGTSGGIILALGVWSLFLAGRRVWESWTFLRRAVKEESNRVVLEMTSIRGSHPIYPQLVYRYAGEYRGQVRNDRIHKWVAEIQLAIQGGKLKVMVKYLPEKPQVHRFLGWKILP